MGLISFANSVCKSVCFPFQIFTSLHPLNFPALRWWMAWYPSLKERLLAPLSWQRLWEIGVLRLSIPTMDLQFFRVNPFSPYVSVPFWSDVPPVTVCNLHCCDTTLSGQRTKCFCWKMRNNCHRNEPSFWRRTDMEVTVLRNNSHGNQRQTILM